jgi:Uma2 family endonuclease
MTQAVQKYYSPEEYLAFEEKALSKSEYYQGEIFQMAGGSGRHNQISSNINTILNVALFDRDCIVYPSDMRILVQANGLYTYADTLVVCGEVQYLPNREDTVTNPVLIVEVLSPSTRNYDRGDKFRLYRDLETFKGYLILEQNSVQVEYFSKQTDGSWILRTFTDPNDLIELEALNLELPVGRIYSKVKFPEKPKRRPREKIIRHPQPFE